MSEDPNGAAPAAPALRQRLAQVRGVSVPPRPLDARALAALAANPGCHRRALLDGAGVDKPRLAEALGVPSGFGQSQFAFMRGHAFEARVKADGGAELLRLAHACLGGGPAPDSGGEVPDLAAPGPAERVARTEEALRKAAGRPGGWTLLDHPMLVLEVAGSEAFLEPDAVVVHPDGGWSVVEIKSFPMLDGSADAAKVGSAARQAAVYVLALEEAAARLSGPLGAAPAVRHRVLLVCPKDFSNLPAGAAVDVRKQRAVTRRQLSRLTRVEELADALPPEVCFDPDRPAAELLHAVESVPAAYAPECLSACELAFHCRERARSAGDVTALGRSVRGELGGLTSVDEVLAAASSLPDTGEGGDPGAEATVAALRRAARLRTEALAAAGAGTPDRGPGCR
ncbi:hypothetical protein ACFWMQ_05540 [Streptomyces sp. NPDC058372]|uniref:hypothetical protein n=1 Tax=Streptomyces sp. NPDC058372 TaxID=3346464 RepID=UPI0036675A8A